MIKRIALLAAILAVGSAAIARATIVVNGGMAGIRLGESMTQVRDKLGAPTTSGLGLFGNDVTWCYGTCGSQGRPTMTVRFGLRNHRIFELDTFDPHQRTPTGVGPGTSLQTLLQRIPGLECVFGAAPGEVAGQCRVQVWKDRKTYETWFDTASPRWGSGRVDVVTVDVWPFVMRCHVIGAVTTLHRLVNKQGVWDCPGAYNR